MEKLLIPFRVLWKIWFMFFFMFSLTLLYPIFWFYLRKEATFPSAFKWMRRWSFMLQLFSGITLVVKKKGELPPGPYIICSNHSSYSDIIMMYGVFKEYFIFMGKAEINSWPLFGIFFTSQMNISVDRSNMVESHKALLRAEEEIDRGRNIVIFPEATIPASAPKMKRFKNGAFKLAIDKQVPIVPITFISNWKRLQTGSFWTAKAGPGFTTAVIHPAVETKGMTDKDLVDLRNRIFGIIQQPILDHESQR